MSERTVRFKYASDFVDSRANGREDLPLLSVSQYRGVLPRSEMVDREGRADDLSHYKVCRAGDVVLNRMSAYQGALGLSPLAGLVSPDYSVIRPRATVDGRFLTYLMKSQWFVGEMTQRIRGIGSIDSGSVRTPRINNDSLGEIEFRLPPLDVQRRIADFLDDQTTRIDKAIQLRQKQAAAMDRRYLSRWEASAREISEAFPVVPMRRVLRSITDGPFGSSLTSSHYSNSGTRVIRLGNLGRGEFRNAEPAFITNDYAWLLRHFSVRPGDLIIAGLGDERWPLGRCGVVPADFGPAIVKADCYRVRLNANVSHEFAAWYLSSPVVEPQLRLLARGATRARLNTDVVRDAPIALADSKTQTRALLEWKDDRRTTAAASNLIQQSADLLQERKRSLITAAVTGEFDVSSASSRAAGVATSGAQG